jgi:hypothetical protein
VWLTQIPSVPRLEQLTAVANKATHSKVSSLTDLHVRMCMQHTAISRRNQNNRLIYTKLLNNKPACRCCQKNFWNANFDSEGWKKIQHAKLNWHQQYRKLPTSSAIPRAPVILLDQLPAVVHA